MTEATQTADSLDAKIARDRQEIKKALGRIKEFNEIVFVPQKEERVGYFPNLEDLPGHSVLARFAYGTKAPNMSAVFFDASKGESRELGLANTKNFLVELGFNSEKVIQTTGKFEGEQAQILEVDLDTVDTQVVANVLFTRDPRVSLIIKPADCPTGVLYCKDKDGNGVVAIIHGGADAINAGMTRQGLTALQLELGVDLSQAKLGIFPGVSKENYYISRQWRTPNGEIKRRETGIFPLNWGEFITPAQTDNPEEKRYVDILSAFEMQALQSGMKPENIEAYRMDTYADAARGRAYSRRYSSEHSGAHPGGQIVAVALSPQITQELSQPLRRAA